jgi:DNA gyrase subunit A
MIPEAGRTAKGQNIVNILDMVEGEKITACISVDGFSDDRYLTMVTRNGVIKRTLLSEYEYQRKGGKIALNLDEGDELVFVVATEGECDLLIATAQGQAVRFSEGNVRAMGRTARGVRGISLRDGDYVAGVCVVEPNKDLLCITENGFGKRSPFDDFRLMKNRGGFGVTCYNLTEKSGILTGIAAVDDSMDLMMITDSGTIIRTPVEGIPTRSRSAGGVIVMRLGEDQKLVNFTTTPHSDEVEAEEREDANDGSEVVDVEAPEAPDETAPAAEDAAEEIPTAGEEAPADES